MNLQHLLDFIGRIEAAGNYDAIYGKAYSKHDLSQYTLNQILEQQRQRINDGGQSATGKYQFIRKTLKGLRDAMNLTGDEKFTPELQDRMAIQLLEWRGLKRWQSGRLSDEQFANNLAKEWASLPVIETGRSYYAGDGLNKSLITPEKVLECLRETRAGAPPPEAAPKPTPKPQPAPPLPQEAPRGFWAWLKGLFI